jgi:hypothetical protein
MQDRIGLPAHYGFSLRFRRVRCRGSLGVLVAGLATLVMMTNTPAGTGDGFELVVGSDGALTVPADELARHGVRPGAHLRVVAESEAHASTDTHNEQGHQRPRKSMRGALAHMVTPEDVDAFVEALAETKAERISSLDAS